MKELSLNILDIAKNSVRAEAKNIGIFLDENDLGILTLKITDDGCGMTAETVEAVSNPFYTSRKTRKVGLGIPFLILASRQADGDVEIISRTDEKHGTEIIATFNTRHIDFTPLGDVTKSILTLIQGNPEIDYVFEHRTPKGDIKIDTKEIKEILGEDISLAEPEIVCWLREFIEEQYNVLN